MQLVDQPVWKRFWYPVAFVDEIDSTPVARTLLGVPLVLWRPAPGFISGAVDRCPHRDAPLSAGWMSRNNLVCPYHGWEWEASGRVACVPQTPSVTSFPERFALDTVKVAAYCGAAWVCLSGEPLLPLPDLPDGSAPGWRFVREFDEEWPVSAPRLIENSFDPAHTTFVHRASFGYEAQPEMDAPEVTRTPHGLVMRNRVTVVNSDLSRASTGESDATTVRDTVTELHGPFLRVARIEYPNGRVHQIVTAATPVDDNRLRLVQWAVRNDTEAQAPAAGVVAFDRRVTEEDRVLLERIRVPYSAELQANVHIKVDRATVEIRRIYLEIMGGRWPSLTAVAQPGSTPQPDSETDERLADAHL